MSFDLRLENGDIKFGPTGSPEVVEETEKLKQDISKILLTRQGEDPGATQYGSKLQDILGQKFDVSIVEGLVAKTVSEATTYLQSLQFVQSVKQDLDFNEVLGLVNAISVSSPSFGRLEVQLAVTSVGGQRTIFAVKLGE